MNKPNIILILTFICQIDLVWSQSYQTDPNTKSQIQQLGFLVGKWKGSGWVMGTDMKKLEFDQTEDIRFKLDSTVLMMEGVGMAAEKVVHNALALVIAGEQEFSFQSYLQNGRKGEFKAEIKDQEFRWYPTDEIRYIIRIDEKGQWVELGEITKGGNWYQFLEIKLNKVE